MSQIHAVRRLKFDAGHRVVNHESKCRTLHGHEYKLELYAEANELDALGRVIDFSDIKKRIGDWVDEFWDHNLIIWKDDPNLEYLFACDGAKAPYVTLYNPTAENMAIDLIENICPPLMEGTGIKITKIRLHETENCYVEVRL